MQTGPSSPGLLAVWLCFPSTWSRLMFPKGITQKKKKWCWGCSSIGRGPQYHRHWESWCVPIILAMAGGGRGIRDSRSSLVIYKVQGLTGKYETLSQNIKEKMKREEKHCFRKHGSQSHLTSKWKPSFKAMARKILEETVLDSMYASLRVLRSGFFSLQDVKSHHPSRAPSSLPENTFHSPLRGNRVFVLATPREAQKSLELRKWSLAYFLYPCSGL